MRERELAVHPVGHGAAFSSSPQRRGRDAPLRGVRARMPCWGDGLLWSMRLALTLSLQPWHPRGTWRVRRRDGL